jgi:hypothetical protein
VTYVESGNTEKLSCGKKCLDCYSRAPTTTKKKIWRLKEVYWIIYEVQKDGCSVSHDSCEVKAHEINCCAEIHAV